MFQDGVGFIDTSDTPWSWFYKAASGVWHRVEDEPFSFMSSAQLEKHFIRNPYGVINMTTAGGNFQINFAASIQVNLNTGQTRQIKRTFLDENGFRCKCDDLTRPSLAHWGHLDHKQPYEAFPLRRDSSEYQKIEYFVRNVGLLQQPIVSIYRIQNIDLWNMFCRKKNQLSKIRREMKIEEQMLFHGTSENNLHSICTFNFNPGLSGRTSSHVLGKGTYFAKHASLAAKYGKANANGVKVMLMSRVILGRYTNGRQNYCTPNDDQNECIYDSCVDDTSNPKVFVIFDPSQIYPEYVLMYRSFDFGETYTASFEQARIFM